MKRLLPLLVLLISQRVFSQATPVVADLGVSQPYVTNLADVPLNANSLGLNQIVKLKIDITNYEQTVSIPTQTYQIIIGLGDKMILDPAFNLASAPLSAFYNWTSGFSGGQVQIVGTLNATLPVDFFGTASFNVKGNVTGSSTVSAQNAYSNFNPSFNLTDPNSINNSASMNYTIVVPLPVNITKIEATRSGCAVDVNWSVQEQLNISRYEIEVSKDGRNFAKVTEAAVQNISNYKAGFALTAQLQAPLLYVRVKAVDRDGSYKYSETRTVAGTCDGKAPWALYLYPNPVTDLNYITVAAKEGVFNGTYKVELLDNSGRLYQAKQLQLINVKSIRYDFNNKMGAGQYMIRVTSTDGTQTAVLKFEKL